MGRIATVPHPNLRLSGPIVDNTVALIVAAGRGRRLPGDRPKQYRHLAGRPVLRWGAEAFLAHPAVDRVQIVYSGEDEAFYWDAVEGLGLPPPIEGGATRQDSARLGLAAIADSAPAKVLIHDGARPIVPSTMIDRVIAALDDGPAAIPALPVSDTLKRGADGVVTTTVDRADLWRAQTPQGFRYAAIHEAHNAVQNSEHTDDAAIAETVGLPVALVAGAAENIKITTENDLFRAQRWLVAAHETRVGSGFDVHRFGPGDGVRLAGVSIAHDQALIGHSDADVVLHAVTDALLGALGAGDIGEHFPPSDPTWRDADSRQFLLHAVELMAARGGRIAHIDVTIICERPKISPHRAAMAAHLAGILGLEADRVSIKATTTEGLGFTGRGEGIAAQATATLAMPNESGF
ncbi:MAG: bifunctional 2-C-methyl-D-erythritol 4-phosphate cytidylyltransferase/2-C-methyl-D-erythritol 2,4-cyclodiphosphate synthase [Alphaproteobacteria bacterium]|nr:bifunctional 2-C-methyl-D-erythritol 4-phosphate cytidylyltransferase/2-C-methyl-D-erythritol 2,4-cyclodiphosphate synthase [Alphaproteobacteria bacterium]